MIFISVNTPTKTSGIGAGQASDLKWVESCARQISEHARGYTIVIEKSTLPVRTGELIQDILESSKSSFNSESKISLIYNQIQNFSQRELPLMILRIQTGF